MLFAVPVFSGMQFNARTIIGGDYIEAKPIITIAVTGSALELNQFQLFIDSVQVLVSGNHNYTDGVLMYQVQTALASGVHTFQARAVDGGVSAMSTINRAFVGGSAINIADRPIVYPSPATSSALICYSLTQAADIDFCVYDLKGQIVYNERLLSGAEGAHAGYNQYFYNLTYADGRQLPNGVFVLVLLQKYGDKTTILGKRKFMVLRDEK